MPGVHLVPHGVSTKRSGKTATKITKSKARPSRIGRDRGGEDKQDPDEGNGKESVTEEREIVASTTQS